MSCRGWKGSTRRLLSIAVLAMAAPVAAAACGGGSDASDTLPPMITTTTTTTLLATTTTRLTYYVVQSGDTLSKIAESFGVDPNELMAVNGITDPNHIERGAELKIPPPKQVAQTLPSTAVTSSTIAP
jgi:LysM repeat protein